MREVSSFRGAAAVSGPGAVAGSPFRRAISRSLPPSLVRDRSLRLLKRLAVESSGSQRRGPLPRPWACSGGPTALPGLGGLHWALAAGIMPTYAARPAPINSAQRHAGEPGPIQYLRGPRLSNTTHATQDAKDP